MQKEELQKVERAHEIALKVIDFAHPLVKENSNVLDITEKIEKKIYELGGKPSWPVNISINEIAAHFTPTVGDTLTLKENDYVKVDLGVQVDGYISDHAFTVKVGHKDDELIEASCKATEEALKALKPGVKVFEVSDIIENVVAEFNFNPIRNLAGHATARYNQHEEPSISNARNKIQTEIPVDTPIAIEVFTTPGTGWVKESRPLSIYRFREDKPVRMWEAKKILELSKTEFDKLPFGARWIKSFTPMKVEMALRQLVEIEALDTYPPLKEESNQPVAVTEDTKIIRG